MRLAIAVVAALRTILTVVILYTQDSRNVVDRSADPTQGVGLALFEEARSGRGEPLFLPAKMQ